MRANEIIRGLLDFIDGIDGGSSQPSVQISIDSQPIEQEPVAIVAVEPEQENPEDIRRFKQIVDLAGKPGEMSPFSNSPNEKYAGVDAVTKDAGGGVNGPKHPADIKSNSISMYPNFLAKGE
jgi:hypothetical protein